MNYNEPLGFWHSAKEPKNPVRLPYNRTTTGNAYAIFVLYPMGVQHSLVDYGSMHFVYGKSPKGSRAREKIAAERGIRHHTGKKLLFF